MKTFMATLLATVMLSLGPAVAAPEDEVKAAFDRFVVAQNAHDGQPALDTPFLMNQTFVKSAAGWCIASILPIPLPAPAPAPAKRGRG